MKFEWCVIERTGYEYIIKAWHLSVGEGEEAIVIASISKEFEHKWKNYPAKELTPATGEWITNKDKIQFHVSCPLMGKVMIVDTEEKARETALNILIDFSRAILKECFNAAANIPA